MRHARRKESAGLLLYRRDGAVVEVLLAHSGGPFWHGKDESAWTIPKGEIEAGEDPLAAARREFMEETGYQPDAEVLPLGSARQPGGKTVHVWAVCGDWDPSRLVSGSFSLEWPPASGRTQLFPEIDRAEWFSLAEAGRKILKGQMPFLERLSKELAARPQGRPQALKHGPRKGR